MINSNTFYKKSLCRFCFQKTIVLGLFIAISNSSYSQSKWTDTILYEIVYDLKYQVNKLDTQNIQHEDMILRLGNTVSEFFSFNKYLAKEKAKDMEMSGKMDIGSLLKLKPKINYRVVKNVGQKEMLFFNNLASSKLYYNAPIDKFKWKLDDEEEGEILGYKCKKATTKFAGRDYIAWYSTDILIPDGPYKFCGLPGLILSVYDVDLHYTFNLVSLKKVHQPFHLDDEKHLGVSKTEYLIQEKKYKEKPSLLLNTDIIKYSQKMLDKFDEDEKARFVYENNPLELR